MLSVTIKAYSCLQPLSWYQHAILNAHHQVRSQPSTGGGRFPQILDLFRDLKIEVPSGCLGETSISKIIMIDDVK